MASKLNGLSRERIIELYMERLDRPKEVVDAEHSYEEQVLEEEIFEQYQCWKVANLKPDSQGRLHIQSGSQGSELKCHTYHLAYKWKNPDVNIPDDLGKGPSIDHLCGRAFCHRPSHLQLVSEHKKNTDRIGCFGNMYIVDEDGYVGQHYKCDHVPTCMKIRIHRYSPYSKY